MLIPSPHSTARPESWTMRPYTTAHSVCTHTHRAAADRAFHKGLFRLFDSTMKDQPHDYLNTYKKS